MATPRRRCKFCRQNHRQATPKEERFAAEYLVDLVAAHAAKRAGYTRSTCEHAYALLQRPAVQCLILKGKKAQAERTAITADTVLGSLLRMADVDLGELYDDQGRLREMKDLPLELRKVLAGLEVETAKDGTVTRKVRIPDRVRCWELLGKHLKLFTEVHRLEGDIDVRTAIAEGRRRTRKGEK